MRRLGLFLSCCAAVAAGATVMSATAWGATFYVNQRGKSSTCSGPGSNACQTIQQAITQAQGFAPPNTIEVAGEESDSTFKESIELESTRDTELTIKGETPGIVFEGGASPGLKARFPGSVTLSNIKLKASETAVLTSAAVVVGTAVTLDDVTIENERSGGINGIELREKGSLTMNGGSVEMEDGSQAMRWTPRVPPSRSTASRSSTATPPKHRRAASTAKRRR